MMLAFALIIVPFAEVAQGIVFKETTLIVGGAIGLFAGLLRSMHRRGCRALCIMVYAIVYNRVCGDDDNSRPYSQP